jgi:hypothetical protein
MMSEPQEYYILTKAHEAIWPQGVILFWAENHNGYSTFLEKAGKYSEEEARDICRIRGDYGPVDFMVPCEIVDAQAVSVVDIDKFAELTVRGKGNEEG